MGAELGDDWSRKFEDCWPLGSNHEPLLWDLSAYADQPTISATRKAVVIMVPFFSWACTSPGLSMALVLADGSVLGPFLGGCSASSGLNLLFRWITDGLWQCTIDKVS